MLYKIHYTIECIIHTTWGKCAPYHMGGSIHSIYCMLYMIYDVLYTNYYILYTIYYIPYTLYYM